MADIFASDACSSKESAKRVETIGVRRRHDCMAAAASVFLSKIAKHLALLACLMIVGKATGRFTIGELGIFLLTLFATMAHLFGRALSPRLPAGPLETPR
jgi:hypothetical protein